MKQRIQLLGYICLAALTACDHPPSAPAGSSGPIPHAVGSGQSPSIETTSANQAALGPDIQLAQHVQESNATSSAQSEARQEAMDSLRSNDLNFIQRIGNDGQSEEQAALYVASKTLNNEVRNYAARLGQDHGKANQDLRTFAAKRRIEIPPDPQGQLRVKLDQLRQLNGAEMDEFFLREFAVQAHMDSIALFEVQEQQTRDKELKEFVSRQLQKLRKHYEQGKALQGKYASAGVRV